MVVDDPLLVLELKKVQKSEEGKGHAYEDTQHPPTRRHIMINNARSHLNIFHRQSS
jgi:hypothetical protein